LKTVILCYGKTPTSPGIYLERALRKMKIPVRVETQLLDGKKLDSKKYMGVIFIETPRSPKAKNMEYSGIPRLFWIHHGKHRLQRNLALVKQYKPHRILMSHSLHLSGHFPVPVEFYPFGVSDELFNSRRQFKKRRYAVAFVGHSVNSFYKQRNKNLRRIRLYLSRQGLPYVITNNITPRTMAQIYGKAKIVFNQSSEKVPETINMRIFEGIGCGALVLTNPAPHQNFLFKDRIHYILYKNSDDLMKQLKFFLSHQDLAEKIARQGYREAMNRHTYVHRTKKAISILKKIAIQNFKDRPKQ
jgi:hypothetical protein